VVQAIAKVPFSWAFAYHIDQQVELADVILADPGYPGWLHMAGSNLRQPVLAQPIYNTRTPDQVLLDIAERVGFLPKLLAQAGPAKGKWAVDVNKTYTWEDLLDRQLKTDYGDDKGLEWFKANGVAPAEPVPANEVYGYHFYPKGKTRIPIYFEYLLWVGAKLKADLAKVGVTEHPHPDAYSDYMALPAYKAGPVLEAPAEFDLVATNWKSTTHTMGLTQDNPYLNEIASVQDHYLTAIWMNRATAEAKGFKDGDIVWVQSNNSGKRQKGPVKLSEVVHPKSVLFGATMNNWSKRMNPDAQAGMIYNMLISSDFKYIDPISGGIEVHSAVKVYKA
jgi:anaerobic selenocysteine-containing dehydrogenase